MVVKDGGYDLTLVGSTGKVSSALRLVRLGDLNRHMVPECRFPENSTEGEIKINWTATARPRRHILRGKRRLWRRHEIWASSTEEVDLSICLPICVLRGPAIQAH